MRRDAPAEAAKAATAVPNEETAFLDYLKKFAELHPDPAMRARAQETAEKLAGVRRVGIDAARRETRQHTGRD